MNHNFVLSFSYTDNLRCPIQPSANCNSEKLNLPEVCCLGDVVHNEVIGQISVYKEVDGRGTPGPHSAQYPHSQNNLIKHTPISELKKAQDYYYLIISMAAFYKRTMNCNQMFNDIFHKLPTDLLVNV